MKAFPLPFEGTNVPSVGQQLAILQKARDEALAVHELARCKVAERIR
jgi:hypothetical protein